VGSRGLAGGCILGLNEDVYDTLEFSDGKYFIGKHSLLLYDGRADVGRSGLREPGRPLTKRPVTYRRCLRQWERHMLHPALAYVENLGESQAWKTCMLPGRFS
jgi:hypothetical protein